MVRLLPKLFLGVSLYKFLVNIHSPEIIQFPVQSTTLRLTQLALTILSSLALLLA